VEINQFERNCSVLEKYIPAAAVVPISKQIMELRFKLKITKQRNTKLGDYRAPDRENPVHRITINHNLNPYQFLITLVHEIAHLTAFNKHGWRIEPHGKEWQWEYKQQMLPYLKADIFPEDILKVLYAYIQSPSASSCADEGLIRVLKKYNSPLQSEGVYLLEQLPHSTIFKYNGNRLFVKGERIRKRYRCKELGSNSVYLFSPVAEVEVPSPELEK
jgi:SprT protein